MSEEPLKPGFRKLVRTLRKAKEAETETTVFEGVDIEQKLPCGCVRLVIGEITISRTKRRKGKGSK